MKEYANWTYESRYCSKDNLRKVVNDLRDIAIQGDFKKCYILKDNWNFPKNADWVKCGGHYGIKVIGIKKSGNEFCVYLNNCIMRDKTA